MKKVLISISAKWCELIFNGQKTIEVCKSFPKQFETPFEVYVYQTKHKGKSIVSEALNTVYGGGKVIGSFVCDRVRLCIPFGLKGHLLSQEVYREMCLTKEQLDKYGGLKTLYGWHITAPKLFDKPRELGEFKRLNRKCKYGDLGYANPNCNECKECNLTRAPQSWCYVEDK